MKPAIKKILIKAILSGDYLLNLKDKDAPLCEILPNGDHRFSPAGVLCDLAPVRVADWGEERGVFCRYMPGLPGKYFSGTPAELDQWAGVKWVSPPINGHRTQAATIKAIEEL